MVRLLRAPENHCQLYRIHEFLGGSNKGKLGPRKSLALVSKSLHVSGTSWCIVLIKRRQSFLDLSGQLLAHPDNAARSSPYRSHLHTLPAENQYTDDAYRSHRDRTTIAAPMTEKRISTVRMRGDPAPPDENHPNHATNALIGRIYPLKGGPGTHFGRTSALRLRAFRRWGLGPASLVSKPSRPCCCCCFRRVKWCAVYRSFCRRPPLRPSSSLPEAGARYYNQIPPAPGPA